MKKNTSTVFIIVLFVFGFIYRYCLSSLSIKGNFWDMEAFHNFALLILKGKWVADCCTKNPGYGAFLALIYYFFGINNLFAVRIIQIILDLVVAFLLYLTGKRLFGRKSALIILILYIINPFTAAFTGLKLSEIVTIFYFTILVYLISLPLFNKSKITWIIWGIILGLLLFTREQYLYLILLLIPIFAFVFYSKIKILVFILFSFFGFALICWYQVVANFTQYKVIRINPPYADIWGGGLYSNFYNDARYNEVTDSSKMNTTFVQLASQFHNVPILDKLEYEKMYKILFFQKIKTDWPVFVENTIRNMFWLWDKEHLYQYVDVFYPSDKWAIRVINICLLFFCFFGLVKYYIKNKAIYFHNQVVLFTLVIFCYITFVFSLVSNESRHTIAAYSLVIFWAGYGLANIKLRKVDIKYYLSTFSC
jgi:4-amino-4-deoxy-L-arabinose transferase-like glycosyltransferase